LVAQEENERWERLVAELQREIQEREQALYSAKVLEQVHNPQYLGRMEAPDAQAVLTGWCGDTMEMYLRLNGHTIQRATFMTDGCGPSVACGNMLATLVQGATLDEASQLRPRDLLLALDGLPEESTHCAELAVNTLRKAIAQQEQGARASASVRPLDRTWKQQGDEREEDRR
jgi:nitrogen fixation NifU-like protein